MEGLNVAEADLVVYARPSKSNQVRRAVLHQLSSLLFTSVIPPSDLILCSIVPFNGGKVVKLGKESIHIVVLGFSSAALMLEDIREDFKYKIKHGEGVFDSSSHKPHVIKAGSMIRFQVKRYGSILKVPKGIRRLKQLRNLGLVRADNVQLLQEIGELVDLQKLAICFGIYGRDLARGMLEEISALLSKLNSSLRSLIISHVANDNLKKALEEVASPPLLLCKLKIYGKIGGLPPWLASLKEIVQINLGETILQPQDLQVLKYLHTLVKLVIEPSAFGIANNYLVFDREGFTHLKFLKIAELDVSFEEGAVQSLEVLKIFSFSAGYSFNGIEHLHSLKEVHINTRNEDIIETVKNIAASHSNRPKCFATLIQY